MDWSDPKAKISNNFTVKEAIWLPQWDRLATERDGLGQVQKDNLVRLFKLMDWVRGYFNKPVIVHVAFRSYSYNKLVGGAPSSAHLKGMAVDFHVAGIDCDAARTAIVPKLEEWGMRCEDLPGSSWIHLDTKQVGVGAQRFFKP